MNASDGVTRRQFLIAASTLAAGRVSTKATGAAAERKGKGSRPNILFAIADDWSWPHAGIYGDNVVKTPTFDRIAREGILFTSAFTAAPTCTASRGSILTGQAAHRLEEGANLWSLLPAKFPVYPDILEEQGYVVGRTGKGWGPGSEKAGGRKRNAAGPPFPSFAEFLRTVPADRPFCYWWGSRHPHRFYKPGVGIESGLRIDEVVVPGFLPDAPEVRSDILDYYWHVQQFDAELAALLETLDASGRTANTLVVVTSDNGMPFPYAKTNLYDAGTRVPLAIRWPGVVKPGRKTDELVSLTDIAPTFLEAAGIEPLKCMTGRSLMDILTDRASKPRETVFTERERHTIGRVGRQSYPMRAVRTHEFLYIRNLRPHLWPMGDPRTTVLDRTFADIDESPTKRFILENRHRPEIAPFFERCFLKRPEEELFDLKKDPWQLTNVVGKPEYEAARKKMRAALDKWMQQTDDPRAKGDTDFWDKCPYLKE